MHRKEKYVYVSGVPEYEGRAGQLQYRLVPRIKRSTEADGLMYGAGTLCDVARDLIPAFQQQYQVICSDSQSPRAVPFQIPVSPEARRFLEYVQQNTTPTVRLSRNDALVTPAGVEPAFAS
jgi:hypothetical protein